MKLIGDFAVKTDNQPKGINVGGFLHKTMRIAGSGIYRYHRSEASVFGLDPKQIGDQQYFNIYRPAEVLKKNKDMFARVPIITGRHRKVDIYNAKELTAGLVGDTVEYEIDENDGELYLYTTGTIITGDGVEAYEKYGQLSVGYVPTAHWEKGEHKGQAYDAILDDFNDVNHLLICAQARGGPQLMVMDSIEDTTPLERFIDRRAKVFENIFKSKKKKVMGDARVPILLSSIALGADPKAQIAAVREIVGDSKNETFNDYLSELEVCGDEKPDVKKKAVEIVVDFYSNVVVGDTEPNTVPSESSNGKETTPSDIEGDAEEEKKKKEEDEKKKKEEDEKTAGDALDARLNSFKEDLMATIKPLFEKEQPPSIQENPDAIGRLTAAVAGDSKPKEGKITSDDVMKNLIGR